MKKNLIILVAILISQLSFCQTDSIMKAETSKHGNLVAYLYELRQIQGEDNIKHVDSLLNYKINIPIWWKIRETPNTFLFGGTFPSINGIENALLFKSFQKEKFKNLDDFENWIIKDYKIGDIPKWSNSHTLLLKKENEDFKKLGKSYFVQLMRGGKLYQCQYIIIETSKTYLWIDFTATKETYDTNFEKLKELIIGFEIIK
jgi:hypothetical protein